MIIDKSKTIRATDKGILVKTKEYTKFHKYDESYTNTLDKRTQAVNDTAESLFLNVVQREMYRRLMYGLSNYTPEQISVLNPLQITEIVKQHEKAKRILHIMKAKVYYAAESKLLTAIFPNSKVGTKDHDWYLDLPKCATLKRLGISTKEIIDEFIKRHMLPKNFYNLNADIIML